MVSWISRLVSLSLGVLTYETRLRPSSQGCGQNQMDGVYPHVCGAINVLQLLPVSS